MLTVEASMEHKSVEQLKQIAAYCGDQPRQEPMSQRERLERWAALLERQGCQALNAFDGTEHRVLELRNRMRCAGSPITVAFTDPVLRDEGMKSDTYGEAKRFFGLSDFELHSVICDCHYGSTISATAAAWRVRNIIPRTQRSGLLARAWRFLTG
jgi:hypothetical protein